VLDLNVAVFNPSERLPFPEGGDAPPCFRIILGKPMQERNAPHTLGRFCAGRKRPRSRADEKRDELAPL
jgi:hypothetical protein